MAEYIIVSCLHSKLFNLIVKKIVLKSLFKAVEIKKQRKDLAYFQRWRAKMSAKMGWESNKLQKHYRRQDIMF
jgi:hypothetical protein